MSELLLSGRLYQLVSTHVFGIYTMLTLRRNGKLYGAVLSTSGQVSVPELLP